MSQTNDAQATAELVEMKIYAEQAGMTLEAYKAKKAAEAQAADAARPKLVTSDIRKTGDASDDADDASGDEDEASVTKTSSTSPALI